MQMPAFPFEAVDWEGVDETRHPGETGEAKWRTRTFGDIRIRRVEYSPGYRADHWCMKGHVLLCLAGALHTELKDGRWFVLKPGMSYQVGDDSIAHRSTAPEGALLFIVD